MNLYVALLRAINVGGNNVISMAGLKACFEALGYGDVATYIQSGNVLFTSRRSDRGFLIREIENALSKAFPWRPRIVLRSFEQMKAIVEGAPDDYGARPAAYRYDVIFLKEPLTADQAMTSVTANPRVDRVTPGNGVLYCSRLISRASQSHLSRLVRTPGYQNMTIRSWTTTGRLLHLMQGIRRPR